MKPFKRIALNVFGTAVTATVMHAAPDTGGFDSRPAGIWQDGIGAGFQSSVQTLSLAAGATAGFQTFGGQQDHDLALISLSYGHMWGGVMGQDHWFRGNWEWRGELFGGSQFSPSDDWLVGLTPHLRYDFATGTRWVPFIDGGVGVTATGIGPPDLGGAFEFNIQGNAGLHWFLRNNFALTVQAGYLHISSAGIYTRNQGVNGATAMAGLTWFF